LITVGAAAWAGAPIRLESEIVMIKSARVRLLGIPQRLI
jgi:hypothetical protein